ncbi:MAG: alpha/beta fold hydrolase, partial [Betaproteobacteria bacterium]
MRAELVSIPTQTIPLDGLYYEPEGRAAGAALLFHGNTMNFYVGALRFLPPALVRLGLACLAFNRRGHDILSTRNSRVPEGGAFQLAREGIEDNRSAARWMAERGFPHPVIIGHSNGGMLAVRHVADHPPTPALVLLSAHMGGKNILERTTKAGLM